MPVSAAPDATAPAKGSKPGSRLVGGQTLYGLALGIVMLDTRFPRLVGDIGNAATWPFPVHYRIVKGAIPERMAQPALDPALLQPFTDAVREVASAGVRAITTSCGFLAIYQRELAAAVDVPVFASPLLQVPMAAAAIGPKKRVGILTARLAVTERHFAGAGWSSKETPVAVTAPPADSHFVRTFVGDTPEADPERLERDVVDLATRTVREHPDVGALVLECANFAPFRGAVRRATGLPVFDLYTLGMHAYEVSAVADFPH
jgi:hypothetical protein